MLGRIRKTIEAGEYSYDSLEMKMGDIIKIRIHEQTNHKGQMSPTPGSNWFLVDVGFPVSDVYNSDKMIENGDVSRLYTDPTLGDYRKGNYIWLDGRQVEPMPATNLAAKHLLNLSE